MAQLTSHEYYPLAIGRPGSALVMDSIVGERPRFPDSSGQQYQLRRRTRRSHSNAHLKFADVGKNTLGGPPTRQLDASLFKNFREGEKNLQFRTEVFNVFNAPQFN
jgi:hypothetical protein